MVKLERKFLLDVPSDLSGLLEPVSDLDARLKLLGKTLIFTEVVVAHSTRRKSLLASAKCTRLREGIIFLLQTESFEVRVTSHFLFRIGNM